jgi:hypothetical protein
LFLVLEGELAFFTFDDAGQITDTLLLGRHALGVDIQPGVWHSMADAVIPPPVTISRMPLTVFSLRGVPGNRRERIEAAVVAGGRHVSGPHEAWIATDPFNGGFRLLITGAHGFERTVTFTIEDDSAVIAERVRETLEE